MILTLVPNPMAGPSANPASTDADHPPLLLWQVPNGSPCLLQGILLSAEK